MTGRAFGPPKRAQTKKASMGAELLLIIPRLLAFLLLSF